jgi:L-iditol 2-dehydrogenase
VKVAVWYNNQDIRIEDMPRPEPGQKEMLVKVISCGICGSDIVEWYRLPRAPLVPGHELGGEVVETGNSVKKYQPGDRVFAAPKVPCMNCYYCKKGHHPVCSKIKDRLPGGFAEYVLVPESIVKHGTYLLPGDITYDQSTFIEPLACVARAQKLAGLQENQTVMVMGCGVSGLLHVKLAKSKNCRVIATDVNRKKLEFAKSIGADVVVDAKENFGDLQIGENGAKADVIFLCTSALSAVAQAWQCLGKGGVMVFFAVPGPDKDVVVPINDFWMKEIKILTSYYCAPADIAQALHLLEADIIKVDDMITHTLPLSKIVQGFQLVMDSQESIKVLIKPHMIDPDNADPVKTRCGS